MPTDKQIEAALTAYTASYKGFGTRRSAMVAALTAAEQAEPAPAALSGAMNEKAVMVCPQCEGEGEYADGLDEAACSTPCTRCDGNGWIVDFSAIDQAEPALAAPCKHPVWGQDNDGTRVCAKCGLVERPSARSGAVKVKALEWKDERNCECSAETIIGTYEVGFDDGWWAQLEGGSTWDWQPEQDPRSYYGPSAAQAAAQADYVQRILTALEPAEPAADAEAFESCPDCAGSGYSNHPDSGQVCYRCNGQGSYTRPTPSEARLREALEEITNLKTERDRPDDYNRGFADGRWSAVNIATVALAQEDGR